MSRPSKTVEVTGAYDIDYALRRKLAEECGGWINVGGPEGSSAEVWHGDTEYIFSGEGLISFLYAVKDMHTDRLYEALDLCQYIAKAKDQAPNAYMRDAIVARAAEIEKRLRGL